MSSELDDELLELIDGGAQGGRKRPRDSGSGKSNKKRKTDSDAEPESEDGDDVPRPNGRDDDDEKYPLEGKYIDEADREELLEKTEIEREEILAARMDEMERIRDRKHLEKIRQQQIDREVGGGSGDAASDARRTARTMPKDKTKDKSLSALKAKRKARDEKKRNPSSPRPRSRSPDDMDMSMSEDDGDDDHDARDESRDRPQRDKLDEPMSLEAMRRITMSRDDLVKHSTSPFFENIVVGCWVRYCIGNQNTSAGDNQPVYRLCQIRKLVPAIKPYEIERGARRFVMNDAFELKHGAAEKVWSMAQTSNSEVGQDEYQRLVHTYASEKLSFPTTREATERHMEMQKYITKVATEEDITNMIARKRGNAPTSNSRVLERSRLVATRTLAAARNDRAEMEAIDEQLKTLEAATQVIEEREEDKLAKVNERNRKANMEAVRRAEIEAAERKRRERKAAQQAAANGGGSGTSTPKTSDPSARLRTVPRLFENKTPGGTRPTTPNPAGATTPAAAPAPAKSLLSAPAKSLGAVAQSIEIDLGDF